MYMYIITFHTRTFEVGLVFCLDQCCRSLPSGIQCSWSSCSHPPNTTEDGVHNIYVQQAAWQKTDRITSLELLL